MPLWALVRWMESSLKWHISMVYLRKQIFLHVTIPYAIPYIVSGLRIGLGYSWRSLIGAEMIAASSGIGYWILDAQTMARSDIVHCWYHRHWFVRYYF